MKIYNNYKKSALVLDYIFIVFLISLMIVLLYFFFNYITLIFVLIFICCTFFVVKYLNNKKNCCYNVNCDIECILIDKTSFKVIYHDKKQDVYNIGDIKHLNLDIKTVTYKRGGAFFKGFESIVFDFDMINNKHYKIQNRTLTIIRNMNLIYKLIDILNYPEKYSYTFSGEGVSAELKEKIDFFINHKIRLINTEKDRKELQSFALLLLLIGLGFFLFFIFIMYLCKDFSCIFAICKCFLLYCMLPLSLYIPVLIDNNNINKIYRH